MSRTLTVDLKALRRQTAITDSDALDWLAKSKGKPRYGRAVSRSTARARSNHLDGLANLLSEILAAIREDGDVVLVRGKEG